MAEPRRGYGPPPETVAYLEKKGWKPSFSWRDVMGDEHANATAIAKVTEVELASAFTRSLQRAQANGEGFENWRKKIVEDLHAIGWGLPRHVADPTGRTGGAEVDFTSRRRLKTIFWGNMASARAAGQWERAQRSKFALPYFLYLHTTSAHPRRDHLQWVGLILPVDSDVWTRIFPPNGWHCKCAVSQISARERSRYLEAGQGPDGVTYTDVEPTIEMRTWTNRRTGEQLQVPKGCDPGWGGNPGLARVRGTMAAVERALVEASPADATRMLEDLWQSPWTRVTARLPDHLARQVWMPAGVSPQLQALTGARSPLVSISGADIKARANLDGRYGDNRSLEDVARLPRIVAEGRIAPDDNPRRHRIIWESGKQWWRAIVTRSDTGYLRAISVHQRPASASRRELGLDRIDREDAGEE